MLPRNVLAPSGAILLISTPIAGEKSTETCTVGLPTTRFRRMTFPWTVLPKLIPLVFPLAILSSTMLSLVKTPIPKSPPDPVP